MREVSCSLCETLNGIEVDYPITRSINPISSPGGVQVDFISATMGGRFLGAAKDIHLEYDVVENAANAIPRRWAQRDQLPHYDDRVNGVLWGYKYVVLRRRVADGICQDPSVRKPDY